MLRQLIVSSFVVPLALGATACGGSHTRTLDTGIAGDRPVRDLSSAEMTQLCEATSEFFLAAQDDAQLRESSCLFQVLASHATTTPAGCEAAVAACVADAPPTGEPLDCSGVTPLPECDALVGDFEVCATDQVNAFVDAAAGLDCSLVGSPDLDARLEERAPSELPESCGSIAEDPGCRTVTTEG